MVSFRAHIHLRSQTGQRACSIIVVRSRWHHLTLQDSCRLHSAHATSCHTNHTFILHQQGQLLVHHITFASSTPSAASSSCSFSTLTLDASVFPPAFDDDTAANTATIGDNPAPVVNPPPRRASIGKERANRSPPDPPCGVNRLLSPLLCGTGVIGLWELLQKVVSVPVKSRLVRPRPPPQPPPFDVGRGPGEQVGLSCASNAAKARRRLLRVCERSSSRRAYVSRYLSGSTF